MTTIQTNPTDNFDADTVSPSTASFLAAASASRRSRGVEEWTPQIPKSAYMAAAVMGGLGAYAPQWFELPAAFAWLRYPSSMPVSGLFCFGLVLALFRVLQLLRWMLLRDRWTALADQHSLARLAIADDGLTPEAMQESAFRETRRSMRAMIMFPHWLLYAICFALLVLAIPMFLVHVKALGRQTDLLAAAWIPGILILAASVIWLMTTCSSAFAGRAIQLWYDESMATYAKRHAAALANLDEAFQSHPVSDVEDDPDDVFADALEPTEVKAKNAFGHRHSDHLEDHFDSGGDLSDAQRRHGTTQNDPSYREAAFGRGGQASERDEVHEGNGFSDDDYDPTS